MQQAVLVPGLWMPAAAMTMLAARLARAGYAPHYFSYRGRSSVDSNVERLARYAREVPGAHFIGHSLGGVLILETLNRHAELAAGSALLLGAPVRGCFAGRRFGRARFGRWMLGASERLWDEHPARWRRAEPLGVIAGTRAARPRARIRRAARPERRRGVRGRDRGGGDALPRSGAARP